MTVVALRTGDVAMQAREPWSDLVSELEELLEKARAGEVQGASIAYVYADGVASWVNTARQTSCALIGAIETAKAAMVQAHLGSDA